MTRMTGPDCVVMCNLINTYIHTYIHTYIILSISSNYDEVTSNCGRSPYNNASNTVSLKRRTSTVIAHVSHIYGLCE